MGGGKAGMEKGREGGHRTHQHYDDDDEDDFLLRFLLHRIAQWEKKVEIELVALVIIIFLHTLLQVR